MSDSGAPLLSKFRSARGIIYTSGLVSVPGDAPTQIRGCFEKLKATLAEAGLSMEDVQKVTVFLANLDDRDKYLNPIWREYFPVSPPCRTTIQAGLGRALVEIEAIAARPG
jgi:2-iminobutanoate/2-iminopropanoate deaminase